MKRKKTLKKRIIGVACTIIGLAIAAFGMKLDTEKQYAGGEISVKEVNNE